MDDKVLINKNKLNEELQRYRKVMSCLQGDLPIQVLCLPKIIENKLLKAGCFRIFDMIDFDLTKVKGLGNSRRALLCSRLDEFFFVSL